MKVLIAIDSLKGSLTSLDAGQAIENGIRKVYEDANIRILPLADGGEGTVEALTYGMGGELEKVTVTGPMGQPVNCVYGLIKKNKTAVIEMAEAAGITLIAEKNKNPLDATTYGVGEIILDALSKGCRSFIIGIGGSATNDGGIGMLQALGYGILDKDGHQVPFGAKGLSFIQSITNTHIHPALLQCTFRIACDVTNPLCGPQGCSTVFGPQKGADPTMVSDMDQWLFRFATLSKEKYPNANFEEPGVGAAGGLGFAFRTFTNSVLESGVKIVLEETKLETYVQEVDIVITGEGRLDAQTIMGKAPIGVAKMAKKYDKKVIAFSGVVTTEASICNRAGIDAFFPILRTIVTKDEAMKSEVAKNNLTDTAEQVFRLIHTIQEL